MRATAIREPEDRGPDAADLKYAVLHLQAAVEVLLKARLMREHWSLVFKDTVRLDDPACMPFTTVGAALHNLSRTSRAHNLCLVFRAGGIYLGSIQLRRRRPR